MNIYSSIIIQMMIVKLFRSNLTLCFNSFSTLRKVGREAVPELPYINYPTKPKPLEDERMPTKLAYEAFPYLKKDKLPNCRYFAVEFKNRIYHFFNAYYYPLGRMLDKVSVSVRGKNSPHYQAHTANVQHGDVCVIVNIQDPLVTGKKLLFKKLRYHTGFVGHLREYSYTHILNTKPELLYHYLLRKTMPKNKLSQKYLDNLVLCRGPTHAFPNFPQFAPDKKIYEYLPETDIEQYIKTEPGIRVAHESTPGAAEEFFGKKVQLYEDERTREQRRREQDENIEDLSQIHEDVTQFKTISAISHKKFEAAKRKAKRIEERYIPVRAPYKKKSSDVEGLKFYRSEKRARKDPNYELLRNEELEEVDEENSTPNPHVPGGAVETPKK